MAKPNNQTILDHRQRAWRAMVFIDQNLDQVCPIDRLAQEVCLSPFYFNRVFAGCTGETLKQYWVRNRMQHAAQCLMNGHRKVIDIAMDIGYESHNAFSKAFRKWYGLSPRAFRDRSINIDSFAFTFSKLGPFHPTYLSSCPFVRTIQPRQFIYLNAYGLLNGTFVKTAMQRLAEVESALSQLGLAKYIWGRVGAFPTRPTRFLDPDEPIQVGAIIAKPVDRIKPLKSRLLGGGRWAVFCHIGPFEFVMQRFAKYDPDKFRPAFKS